MPETYIDQSEEGKIGTELLDQWFHKFFELDIKFQLLKNGETVQDGTSQDLIFDFETLICYISKFYTLQQGDYIFTGTPAGVGPVKIGDKLEGILAGKSILHCEIK